jgi:hypothetical protein
MGFRSWPGIGLFVHAAVHEMSHMGDRSMIKEAQSCVGTCCLLSC